MSSDTPSALSNVSPFRAGLATMLVGAVLAVVGLVQTTSATVQPSCPPGTELIAKFEYKRGRYEFEKPRGNESVVTISNANAKGGNWSSTQSISVILVKGGPGSKTVTLNPPQKSGTFSNEGLKTGGKGKHAPDISNIQFCGPKGGGTTTTKPEDTTTSTTEPEDTTTSTTEPEDTTTSSTEPEDTTTSTSEPEDTTTSTSEPEDTTTSTTEPDDGGEVQGRVIVNTTITPDDTARVLASGQSLPRTGAPSVPLVVIGIVLLALGGTLSIVNRKRGAES